MELFLRKALVKILHDAAIHFFNQVLFFLCPRANDILVIIELPIAPAFHDLTEGIDILKTMIEVTVISVLQIIPDELVQLNPIPLNYIVHKPIFILKMIRNRTLDDIQFIRNHLKRRTIIAMFLKKPFCDS